MFMQFCAAHLTYVFNDIVCTKETLSDQQISIKRLEQRRVHFLGV